MSIPEIVATVAGFACVLLTVRQNIWCWPTGLVQSTIYIWLFWSVRLYSDMGLQVIYTVLQIQGWYLWLHGGKDRGPLRVTVMSARERLVWAGVGLGGTLALGTVMQRFTDAALPYLDACATALSLVAQWLMNRKVLESWVFWITVDVLSIGMYLAKGLRLTALLYAAYLIMATMGLFAWKKTLRAAPAA